MLKKQTILLVVLSFLLSMVLALPVFAQEEEENDDLVVLSGTLSFEEDGDIVLTTEDGEEFVIAPAGADPGVFPADYEDGDEVTITGVSLGEGETVQALSVEEGLLDDGEDEGEDEEVEPDATPEPDEDEGDDEGGERGYYCSDDAERDHPAGTKFAEDLDMEYDEVMGYFCDDGLGFGEIMILSKISKASELGLDELLAMREDGMGWGKILKELDLNPGEVFSGHVKGSHFAEGEKPGKGNKPENPGKGNKPENPGGGHKPENPGGGKP